MVKSKFLDYLVDYLVELELGNWVYVNLGTQTQDATWLGVKFICRQGT
jgi:hypothetical protein